jgi:hypothetical protein
MKIRVVGHGGESQFSFGTSGPWCEFRDEIISQGHEISKEEFGAKCDALIAHKHSEAALREAILNGIPISRRILILWEPEIVEKDRYQLKVLENYGAIFTPSIKWSEKVRGRTFNWPQDKVREIDPFEKWMPRNQVAVIIQGNKFSARKGELYTLRRKVIKSLENKVHLFGTNWNRGFSFDWLHWSMSAFNSSLKEISTNSLWGLGRRYKNYHGAVVDKDKTLRKYKIAIVIENSADFVSEKLFDSISAGCLVIYVGPNLLDFGLKLPSLIQVNGNKKEVCKKFEEVTKMSQKSQYLLAKAQNLELRQVSDNWENTFVLRKLGRDILATFK